MGPHYSLEQQTAIYNPPPHELVLIDPGIQFRIYQHRHKSFELMALKLSLHTERQVQNMIENFIARYQHHYLVSTVYLKCQDYSTCGGYVDAIIFYQRIFTNLSRIKDIPLMDALHFYAVAFKGFQILYRQFGYFEIYEDLFFLAQDSKLKVWCNKDISKNQPESYLRDRNGTEEDMVRKIVFIIGQNTDPLTDNLQLKERLIANGVRNFQMALQSLRQVCRKYNLTVPQRVQCIMGLPSDEVRMVLDQYASHVGGMRGYNLEVNTIQQTNPVNTFITESNVNTPYFMQSSMQASKSPSRQQVYITESQSPTNQPVNQFFTTPLSPPSIAHPQPMLQTFNKQPQVPHQQHRKGIDLSLSAKKDRPSSSHNYNSKPPSALSSARNKSLQNPRPTRPISSQGNMNVNNQNLLGRNFSQNAPFISNKNGLLNTQVYRNSVNLNERFMKPTYPQQVTLGHNVPRPVNEIRPNYHFQPRVQIQPQPSIPVKNTTVRQLSPAQRITSQPYTYNNSQIYHSQPRQAQKTPSVVTQKPSILKQSSTIFSNNQQNQGLRKSNIIHVNFTNKNPISQPQRSLQFSRPKVRFEQSPKPIFNPIRQRRASIKSKNNQSQKIQSYTNNNNILTNSIQDRSSKNNESSLKRNGSTPMLGKRNQDNKKVKANPFQIVQKSQQDLTNIQNPSFKPQPPTPIPLTSPTSPLFPANSASSRYVYSNKQLNDNIPDIKYSKKQSPKKPLNRLFDTKIMQLQSFNQSRINTLNSMKQMNNDNSQVLEIIGREKKDSITSAFDEQQRLGMFDIIEQRDEFGRNDYMKFDNVYKNSDSFTDPKILQILRRPSSKALKNELSSLKKVSRPSRQFEFNRESTVKLPQVDRQEYPIHQQDKRLYLRSASIEQNIPSNPPQQFQGFPSLSNLSQINKLEQIPSFIQQKSSPIFNNTNFRSGKRSRFSQQNDIKTFIKKEEPKTNEFGRFEYSGQNTPTYEYSFSSKKQIPIQDTADWRLQYATSNNNNDITASRQSQSQNQNSEFKVIPQKPYNFLTGFSSNQSLASLEFELSKKFTPKNVFDSIKQEKNEDNSKQSSIDGAYRVRVSSAERETVSNRKYKPSIDPEISRDLEMFRKQRNQLKTK